MDQAFPVQNWSPEQVAEMVTGYLRSVLWADVDDAGRPLERTFRVESFTDEAVQAVRQDVEDFYGANRRALCAWTTPDDAGHMFHLSRNRYVAAFEEKVRPGVENTPGYRARAGISRAQARSWLRFNAAMERLNQAARVYGSLEVYIGDDGRLHV